MADPVEDSLFREIDEDLRHERYAKLWKRYGAYVIAAAIALVVVVAGHQGWRSYSLGTREAASEKLIGALDLAAVEPGAAENMVRDLAENGPEGYAMLARFRLAALIGQQGDRDAAATAYWELSQQVTDPIYRDLATILAVQQSLATSTPPADPGALTERLEPITAADNPWRFSARQLTAVIAMQRGDTARAHEIFGALANDPEAPPEIRTLADELLAVTDSN